VAAALVLSACGGGATPARTYVQALCNAATTWQGKVQQGATQLGTELTGNPSPAHGKQVFGQFLDGVIRSTDEMIGRVKAAGTPDVKDGKEAADKVVGTLEQVRAAFQSARAQVDKLPTGDQQAFQQGANQIGSTITSSLSDVQNPFKSSPQLTAVFNDEPACTSLRG